MNEDPHIHPVEFEDNNPVRGQIFVVFAKNIGEVDDSKDTVPQLLFAGAVP